MTESESDEEIREALGMVFDPCSVAAGRPTSILDMGLVLDWEMCGDTLTIRFAVTFAGCTMAPHFVEAACAELRRIPGIRSVDASLDTAHVWEPPASRAMVGAPQAWRKRR
jgi:metal-sulfur cluster biosynthetic enzyme